jgi:hypothetical protein
MGRQFSPLPFNCGSPRLKISTKLTMMVLIIKIPELVVGVGGSKGEVLLTGAGKISRAASALQTEVVAALKAFQRAAQLGMTHIILETDASVVASALCSMEIDRSANGCLVRQIQDLTRMEFSCCSVSLL